jgi:hypothetical protein
LDGLGGGGARQEILKFGTLVIFELGLGHYASRLKENAAIFVFPHHKTLAGVAS